MFKSKYIRGTTVPSYDSAISDAIESYGLDGGGTDMKIAVANLEGTVYRVITSSGMGALVHITSALEDMGFDDLLVNSVETRDGCDCWFVPTAEVKATFEAEQDEKPLVDAATDILSELDALSEITETERQSLILSRVGQGQFRAQLIAYWGACAVTGADCIRLLKASHIKPWRESNNSERLDVFNGLLLSPNLDAAFDAGYITFDQNGKIVLSTVIVGASAFQLHINPKLRINPKFLKAEHQLYLTLHRRNVFLG